MKHCQKCKLDFEEENNFCDECGLKLSAKKSSDQVTNKINHEHKSNFGWFITLSFILSVISILMATFLFARGRGMIGASLPESIIIPIYFLFLMPIIPIISLICNLISFFLMEKNKFSEKRWIIIWGIIFSLVSILPIIIQLLIS